MLKNNKHRLLTAIILWCYSFMLVAQSTPLPDMGSSAGRLLSPYEERILGEVIMQDIYHQIPMLNDPFANRYLQSLGIELVQSNPDAMPPFNFFWVESGAINAFALPGGFIGVNTGLFLQTRTESELAGVMSHEVAHVSQRHLARMFEKAQQMTMPTLAAILGAMAVSAANPALGSALLASTTAGAQQIAIDFTRHNEEEADRIGIQTLYQAGYNPNGMSDFFGRMYEANRYNMGNNIPEFLRTHPMTANRMADAQARASRYPQHTTKRSDKDYAFMKEHIRVLTQPTSQLKSFYQAQDMKNPAMQYGHAMTLIKSRDYQSALGLLKKLAQSNPDLLLISIGQVKAYVGLKQTNTAIEQLEDLLKDHPYNAAIVQLLAQTALEAGKAEQAKQVLRNYLKRFDGNSDLFALLAQTYDALKETKLALIAHADYFASRWNYGAAIQQLKRAEKQAPVDAYQDAIIQAKLKRFEEAERLQKRVKSSI